MGKKHGKNKEGYFKTLKDEEVPDNIKKIVGTEKDKAIAGRQRDFVHLQKEYHEITYSVAVIQAELECMMDQIRTKPEDRTMKWNGMIIPDNVLKTRTGLKNIKYKEGIHSLQMLKKSLLNQGMTEEQIVIAAEDGHYIKEIPVGKNDDKTIKE
jgi:hypothetical protein